MPVSRPRSRHRRRTPIVPLGAVLVAAALVVPLAAGAVTSPFSDVPTSHPFFDEILWMSTTEITQGYPDGTYRPNEPVTRQAMSAFMQRLYDVQEDSDWASSNVSSETGSTAWLQIPGASVQVKVPPGVYANLYARFSGESYCSGPASEWCAVRLLVSKNGGAFQEMFPNVSLDAAFDSTGSDDWESHSIERAGFGEPGSTYTIKAEYTVSAAGAHFVVDDWILVAETDLQPSDYIPF